MDEVPLLQTLCDIPLHSLPSTSSQPILHQAGEGTQLASDIDWVSLFSCPSVFGNQNLQSTSGSLAADGGGDKNSSKYKRKAGRTKKAIPPRIAFHTKSTNDVLDDGYRWRKYGQKSVKNSIHPRSYYRCSHHTCNVKKQVQRLSKDSSIVVTTYEGIHNHPCEILMESLSPLLRQLQFLSRI